MPETLFGSVKAEGVSVESCLSKVPLLIKNWSHSLTRSVWQGGGLRDSFLVDGVAFKKTFSYAGFEMQKKKYSNPKILALNIELELKSEKDNAEVSFLGRAWGDGDRCKEGSDASE